MGDQRRDPEQRPSPDALLEAARRAGPQVGKLKIFVGAAPGVGKTYEMLQAARAKLAEGVDVVVGVVETHGRKETEALLEGLQVLPRKPTIYVNRILSEFDIDALSSGAPSLVLVDELAHTNIPGSRHAKRYQDVEELLENGIDVYTTVNIQHVESLNDVVAQITGVRVRETVPDAILDRADAVELVDLTPDDLIQRLQRGQGLRPQAGRACAQELFLAHQPDGAARACAAAHGRARRRAAARADAGPGHFRSLGRGRAHPGVRERGSEIRRAGALRQAAGRPAARALDGNLHRDAAKPPVQRGRARPAGRDHAAGRAPGRRGHHAPLRRPTHRRRRAGVRAQAECHPYRHRQVHALALVRDRERLGGARPRPARRQHRRARGTRRYERCESRRAQADASGGNPGSLRPLALYRRTVGGRPCGRRGQGPATDARHRERRSRAADGHCRHRAALRPAALAGGHGGRVARLQLLLPAAGLHLHHHRSHQRGGVRAVHHRRGGSLQHGRARAGAHRHGAGARAHDRVALRLQPQARRRRTTRRRCCGPPPTRPR